MRNKIVVMTLKEIGYRTITAEVPHNEAYFPEKNATYTKNLFVVEGFYAEWGSQRAFTVSSTTLEDMYNILHFLLVVVWEFVVTSEEYQLYWLENEIAF